MEVALFLTSDLTLSCLIQTQLVITRMVVAVLPVAVHLGQHLWPGTWWKGFLIKDA